MTDPGLGFTASVPDLLGLTDQLDEFAKGYGDLGKAIGQNYEAALKAADTKSILAGLSGVLISALSVFQQQCDDFMRSHCMACEAPMSKSMDRTADRLWKTAESYAEQDREAEEALDGENPSQEDKDTAKAITDGEPSFDWKLDFSVNDYLTADFEGTVFPEFSFKPSIEAAKKTAEKSLGQGPFTSIDALIEHFCGVSLNKEVCKPLLGDWGVLWYLADMFRAVAQAPTDIGATMLSGSGKVVPSVWAGNAAEAFSKTSENWFRVLEDHSRLFVDSGTKLEAIANGMDIEGTKIAAAAAVIADLAVEVAAAIASGGLSVLSRDAVKWIGKLIFAFPTVVEAIKGFVDFLELAAPDLDDVVSGLASLNPPGNLQDTNS
jgi:uncharacterized protein YukE